MAAKVYLIGAGPGDPSLITLKGVECLRAADVVVYDYLANATLLSYVRPDAKFIFVGKKGFSAHVTQEQINDCLIEEALAGCASADESDVVIARLKGGDPFVFGRGGEEALALRARGIDYEVVPGVTSGIAAPAYAGIPVTHRGVSSSVAFITGNEDPTKEETSIDWNGLAHGAQTLCFYMGIRNLPRIAERLISAGREGSTPVALVRWGTTPHQEVLTGTLADIADKAKAANFQAPAIIVVGDVAGLRDSMAWRENLPLRGMTIAVTRARTQASTLVERLRLLGADVLECPTIQIEPMKDDAPVKQATANLASGSYDWAVFTSVNGVEHFFKHLFSQNLDVRAFANTKIAAIGSATADALRQRGIIVDLMPPEYKAEAIAAEMLANGVASGVRVLIARAKEARDVLPSTLAEAGALVDVVPVYETVPSRSVATRTALEHVLKGDVDAVTFTASSTVRNFAKLLEEALADAEAAGSDSKTVANVLNSMKSYSIGPITTKTLEACGATPAAQAQVYTIDGLVEAIVAQRSAETDN